MDKEFNLSEERKIPFDCIPNKNYFYFYSEKDVKKAVQLLKEEIKIREKESIESMFPNITNKEREMLLNEVKTRLTNIINKIFGGELTNGS